MPDKQPSGDGPGEGSSGASPSDPADSGSFAERLKHLAPRTRSRPPEERLGPSTTQKLFGRRAVQKGYVSEHQVLDALALQYRARALGRAMPLGEILWLQGVIPGELIDELLEVEHRRYADLDRLVSSRFFGDAAISQGFCSPAQVLEALDLQRIDDRSGKPHRRLGEILSQLGYLSDVQMQALIEDPLDNADTTSFKPGTGATPPPEG